MTRPYLLVLVASHSLFALSAMVGAGCNSTPVGLKCDLGTAIPQPNERVLASPSLDCITRLCLRVPDGPPTNPPAAVGLCTAECAADSDCEKAPESPCSTGFTCGIAVTVGPFCCKKFCICKDYVVVPDTGSLPKPLACDETNAANACCNLPGRASCTP
jgi:hypothetical protein